MSHLASIADELASPLRDAPESFRAGVASELLKLRPASRRVDRSEIDLPQREPRIELKVDPADAHGLLKDRLDLFSGLGAAAGGCIGSGARNLRGKPFVQLRASQKRSRAGGGLLRLVISAEREEGANQASLRESLVPRFT